MTNDLTDRSANVPRMRSLPPKSIRSHLSTYKRGTRWGNVRRYMSKDTRSCEIHAVPDYHAFSPCGEMFVEAATVRATSSGLVGGLPGPAPSDEVFFRDYMPIKWGSAIYSKLQKRYWGQPHDLGRPLALTIQDFWAPMSMMMSRSPLERYRYGLCERESRHHAASHRTSSVRLKADRVWFFARPGSENISAVFHNARGTLAKFNRMGIVLGFGNPRLEITRIGTA